MLSNKAIVLLEQVKALTYEDPRSFVINEWAGKRPDGTICACIGGRLCLLLGKKVEEDKGYFSDLGEIVSLYSFGKSPSTLVTEELGLKEKYWSELFFESNWTKEEKDSLQDINRRAHTVAKKIDQFIAKHRVSSSTKEQVQQRVCV